MILGKCTLSDTLKNVVYRRIIFMCFSAKYAIAVNTSPPKKKKEKKVLNLEKGFAVSTPTFSESLMHFNNHRHINQRHAIQHRCCLIINMFTTVLQMIS